MRYKLFALVIFISLQYSVSAQNYWQQEVNYTIKVALNDKDHSLNGSLQLVYINNSPDKLDYIWFHLWPNAYKSETTAYAKQLFREKDGKETWKDMKDRGSIEGLDFTVNGEKARIEPAPDNIDIIKLILPKPLLAGEKATIATPFYVKIPSYVSRSGHIGQTYMICQWYPKPAVYDRKGWHPLPYLDQGEFYSEFGKFDVTISLPSTYIVGATGQLQNADELKQYKEIGNSNRIKASGKNTIKYAASSNAVKSLNYKAENVHDFSWFADKEFVVRYDTLQLPGKTVDVFTYHHADGNKNW